MSLVQCPECSSEVSSNALMCVRCGFPITKSKALSVAILLKDTQMIEDLIQLGADMNVADEHGKTPLEIASEIGDSKILELLSSTPTKKISVPISEAPVVTPPRPRRARRSKRSNKNVIKNPVPHEGVLPEVATAGVVDHPVQTEHAALETPIQNSKEAPGTDVVQVAERIESSIENATPPKHRPTRMIILEDEESPVRIQQSQTSSGLNCLTCGESIKPDEISCSHCKTLIIRRYCSGCSNLIPDHATICPLCGKNVKEHFLYAKLRRAKFFIGIVTVITFTAILFLLLWQQSLSQTTPLQADDNVKRIQSRPPGSTPAPEIKQEEVNIPEVQAEPTLQEIPLREPEHQKEKSESYVQKPIAQIPTETKPESTSKVEESVAAVIPKVEESVAADTHVDEEVANPKMSPSTQRALQLNARQRIRRGRFLNDKGFTLIRNGRPSEAIPLLEQSVRSFPEGTRDVTYAYALFNLAVAYRMSGRPDIAIPILEERIKINNQREVVQRELLVAKRQAKLSGLRNLETD